MMGPDERIADITARRGREEEETVRRILERVASVIPQPAYAAPDAVFIPTATGFAETDALLICAAGIFVCECKHMAGTVIGRPSDRMWTKMGTPVLSFPNPVIQSRRHADAASAWFDIDRSCCHSLVVFNDGCTIDAAADVVRTADLYDTLLARTGTVCLTARDLDRCIAIAGRLASDDKTRQRHTATIAQTKKERRSEKKRVS